LLHVERGGDHEGAVLAHVVGDDESVFLLVEIEGKPSMERVSLKVSHGSSLLKEDLVGDLQEKRTEKSRVQEKGRSCFHQ